MLNSVFIRNMFTVFSSFSPIFAILIEHLPFLNRKRWFISVQTFFVAMTIYVLTLFPALEGKTLSNVLVLYPIFVVAFNFLFLLRFGLKKFSKGLALSLMLTFVLTEMHEIPAFVSSYLKLTFLQPNQLVQSIAPIYMVVVGYLAAKTAKLQVSKSSVLVLVFGVSLLFPLYFFYPRLDFSTNPGFLSFAKRVYCFLLLTLIFWRWSGINHADR